MRGSSFEDQIILIRDELLKVLNEGQYYHLLFTARRFDKNLECAINQN